MSPIRFLSAQKCTKTQTMGKTFHIDDLDRRILSALQKDSRISNQELSARVGSSASSCWRRIRSMEDAGIIQGYGLKINQLSVGVSETIFLQISLKNHSESTLLKFDKLVHETPEIVDCHAITGEYDYILKVVSEDVRSYHRLLRDRLMCHDFIGRTFSQVGVETLKETQGIPVEIIPPSG